MADSQRKTGNLSSVNELLSIRWAVKNDDLTTIINNLDVGTYTLSYSISLTARNDTTDASLYGFRIFVDTTPIVNSMLSWGTSAVGTVKQGTATITITQANKGTFTGAYFYGCGLNASGTTGTADFSNIMLNTGSTALPYEPYGWLHSLRKLGTGTDTLTTLPADLYADGNNATVGLVGNMSQTGTPTPQNPIQPQETGERTGNLFDYQQTTGITDNCYINQSGTVVSSNEYYLSYPIAVDANSTYTWKFHELSSGGTVTPTHTAPTVGFYDASNNLLSVATHDRNIRYFSFTPPNSCTYIRASVYKEYKNEAVLNVGSNPIDYEPYGIKIPILSANTTTPVYLGEVETTRKIKKYEFTGDETFYADITYNRFWTTDLSDMFYVGNRLTPMYCDRYTVIDDGRSIGDVPNNSCYTSASNTKRYYIQSTDYVSETDFKTYLAQQYANGTPVTVWYVLAEPTTGIVNEPIRKIGDYADTVSSISIPTITGKDTFDVLTTLKPSEVSLTYTGWHDASVREWDGSEWQ